MKEKTNRELKHIAIMALQSEYGFAPKQSDIEIIEAVESETNIHILFEINRKEYVFDSCKTKTLGVWCGPKTITKIN